MSHNHKNTVTEADHQPPISESWLSRHAPYVLLLAYLYYCTQIGMEIFGDRFGWVSEMLPLAETSLIVLMAAATVGVASRVVGQVVRRASLTTILRDILGEPTWWRTWYPRALRSPASLWDRLPHSLRVTRTAIWLGMLLLPAGFLLTVFVLPTFQTVYEYLGFQFPSMLSMYTTAVTAAAYVLPPVILGGLVQASRWHRSHGLSRLDTLNALFSGSRDVWRDTDARKLLTH